MTPQSELAQFRAQGVLDRLLPFQRDAAEHAYHRLFEAEDSTRRFLVADEVGLGKTLVAKGVVAKTVERLRGKVDRIDIVYVCSNLSIANQNVERLNMFNKGHAETVDRLTLLPLHLKALAETDISLVALTPGTSLDVRSTLGVSRERQLIAALLERAWNLKGRLPENTLRGDITQTTRFREAADDLRRQLDDVGPSIDQFAQRYGQFLAGRPDLKDRFLALCERIGYKHDHSTLKPEERADRNQVIGELRSALAHCCIDLLEPDLVILDEFQRFKDLLVPAGGAESQASETADLAQQLFNWGRDQHKARLLLLSATPYKPYTLKFEEGEDNHYEDFLRTVSFLQGDTGAPDALRALLKEFRDLLLVANPKSIEQLKDTKAKIEAQLRKVMSRTERQAVTGIRNGMLRTVETPPITLEEADLRAYLALRGVGDSVAADEPVEYWKSAAYALDFMSGYKLKDDLKKRTTKTSAGADPGFDEVVRSAAACALPVHTIKANRTLSPPNAKIRQLVASLEQQGAFDILWIPPSMPNHHMAPAFEHARRQGMTKRLVFSSWNVAPRSIATMVSHAAEVRHAHPLAEGEQQAEQSALLRLDQDNGRAASMTTMAWMHPSSVLSRACDPLCYVRTVGHEAATWEGALSWAEGVVQPLLDRLGVRTAADGEPAEEGWYWAAPFLIDRMNDAEPTEAWWQHPDLATTWSVEERADDEQEEEQELENAASAWELHFDQAKDLRASDWLARPAPRDLASVVALMGLASPANCAVRALRDWMPFPEQELALARRSEAARIGWLFRSLFNRPQAIALVRDLMPEAPYWRQTLLYALGGDLDAVMREYVHVLRAAVPGSAKEPVEQLQGAVDASDDALRVRGAVLRGEQLQLDSQTGAAHWESFPITTLFAMRYGADSTEDASQAQRDLAVRGAFNSPFWPFVLASTSVGQEGLDFHWYCHAVVHWNLPPNPVDMEQREGRVHRFKGHAVRKNVASQWRNEALNPEDRDRWDCVFDKARQAAKISDKGMVPYWLYPAEEGAWVERHVPLLGLSRDVARYEDLKRSLGAYRLVFGQPRQDELLAYLQERVPPDELDRMVDVLRIDLAPPPYDTTSPSGSTP